MAVVETDSRFNDYLHEAVLERGEHVLWSGRPGWASSIFAEPMILIYSTVYLAIIFVFFEFKDEIGISFLAVLLIFLFFIMPFFINLIIIMKLILFCIRSDYVITDRRVLIVMKLFGMRVKSYFASDIAEVQWIDRGSDRGSISFALVPPAPTAPTFKWPKPPVSVRLLGVDGLRQAVRAIQRIKTAGRPS